MILFIKRTTFLFCCTSFRLTLVRTSSIRTQTVRTPGGFLLYLIPLKHLREAVFAISIGNSFPPAALTIKAKVTHCSLFSLLCKLSCNQLVFLQAGLKRNMQFHPCSEYPLWYIFEQELKVSLSTLGLFVHVHTSTASPLTTSCFVSCHCLKLCTQLLDALNCHFLIHKRSSVLFLVV